MRADERAKRRAIEAKQNNILLSGYTFTHWKTYDFNNLGNINYLFRAGTKERQSYNDAVIMADTETSKKKADTIGQNHVVAWTISIRAYGMNVCTLYGHRPDTLVECMETIHNSMHGDHTIIYFHNLPYDYMFERKFLFQRFGLPEKQLNIKPHYPLFINFRNGIQLRDSLMVAQRSLDRWADDLKAPHRKAVGKWDYDKIRTQHEDFTADELEYIEHDTLAGVECLDITRKMLKKHIYSMPFTATGIVREDVRTIGKKNRGHDWFLRRIPKDKGKENNWLRAWEQQQKFERCFHGGYTHANRYRIGRVTYEEDYGTISCYDFASSYPYCMIAEKFPAEMFAPYDAMSIPQVLKLSEDYAMIFRLILIRPTLKDKFNPMPALQFSKCVNCINPIIDNGRILEAGIAEIYCTEQDLIVIAEQYDFDPDYSMCAELEAAKKDYLPRWLRDYVFKLFEEKCSLKGKDPILYSLAKSRLNSVYGLTVQRPVKLDITEDYETGKFGIKEEDELPKFQKYVDDKKTMLPYFVGVYVTAFAFRHLFQLGSCVKDDGIWLYSDTDSAYACGWDMEKLEDYNNECKEKIKASGYGPVTVDGREYWLGAAEHDGLKDEYSEFVSNGAKRYCGRCKKDGMLHITVAGVPKKTGAKCLASSRLDTPKRIGPEIIDNFKVGALFDGQTTGKKLHTYFYVDDIYTDEAGNITGDSIDLSPCDYILDETKVKRYDPINNKWEIVDIFQAINEEGMALDFAGVEDENELY